MHSFSKQLRLNNFLLFLPSTLAHPGTNQNHPQPSEEAKPQRVSYHHVKNILEIPSALLPLPIPNKQVPSCLGNYGLTLHPLFQNKCKGCVGPVGGRVFWRRLALDLNHLLSKPSICPVSSIFSTVPPPPATLFIQGVSDFR
ncbi:hypothetical protein CEXT_328011 [Caerostris extrusa]|uniref:Uncharacterized protein n=1 Tax=Caerostris extrusa TaxID=172846 RepID=A0AAV4WVD0_CAEEX|nr:hypothetical protein CEXT_328011 [Caerostris extrusa]